MRKTLHLLQPKFSHPGLIFSFKTGAVENKLKGTYMRKMVVCYSSSSPLAQEKRKTKTG